ncbi:smu1, partial [Symbiodinium sp. KB8]
MGLATGSVDGFIEIWDPDTLKVRLDLDYQAKDKFMMHNDAILCLAFSKDGDMLASGSRDGLIKVWKVATGACLRKLPAAHPQGITSLCFAGEGTQIISGSFDGTARMHGLRSAKMLKEYREHASYVNDVKVSMDGSKLITASSDGDVK